VEAAERRYHDADVGFHEALALASGNRILTYLFEAMASPLQESFYLTRRGHELRGHTHEHTIAAHRTILNFVRQGDARAAAEAMRTHLEDTERDIRLALGSRTAALRGEGSACGDRAEPVAEAPLPAAPRQPLPLGRGALWHRLASASPLPLGERSAQRAG
jgi:hypothetical protein